MSVDYISEVLGKDDECSKISDSHHNGVDREKGFKLQTTKLGWHTWSKSKMLTTIQGAGPHKKA